MAFLLGAALGAFVGYGIAWHLLRPRTLLESVRWVRR